jgi:hypothetical protein
MGTALGRGLDWELGFWGILLALGDFRLGSVDFSFLIYNSRKSH